MLEREARAEVPCSPGVRLQDSLRLHFPSVMIEEEEEDALLTLRVGVESGWC